LPASAPSRIKIKRYSDERKRVLEIARLHPELPSRLPAVKITDQEAFSVSESTVYRILKENNLIAPRPLPQMPAMKEWKILMRHGSVYAANIFVVGWGLLQAYPGGRWLFP